MAKGKSAKGGVAKSVASEAAAGMRAHGTRFNGGQTVSSIQPMNFAGNVNAQQEDFTPRSYPSKGRGAK